MPYIVVNKMGDRLLADRETGLLSVRSRGAKYTRFSGYNEAALWVRRTCKYFHPDCPISDFVIKKASNP